MLLQYLLRRPFRSSMHFLDMLHKLLLYPPPISLALILDSIEQESIAFHIDTLHESPFPSILDRLIDLLWCTLCITSLDYAPSSILDQSQGSLDDPTYAIGYICDLTVE